MVSRISLVDLVVMSQYNVAKNESHFADVYGYLHLTFNNSSIDGKFIPNNGASNRDPFKIALPN